MRRVLTVLAILMTTAGVLYAGGWELAGSASVYYGDTASFESPAVVNSGRVMSQIPEYQQIQQQG